MHFSFAIKASIHPNGHGSEIRDPWTNSNPSHATSSLKSADATLLPGVLILAPNLLSTLTSLQSLVAKEYRGPQLNLLSAHLLHTRANDVKPSCLPSHLSRQTCGYLLLPYHSFVGGGSPLCLMMKGPSFPHAVLASASLFCSVTSFSLVPPSYYPGVVIDWALYRPRTRATTTYLTVSR